MFCVSMNLTSSEWMGIQQAAASGRANHCHSDKNRFTGSQTTIAPGPGYFVNPPLIPADSTMVK